MSKANDLARLLDTSGDVVVGSLDNIPTTPANWSTLLNKPTLATSATTDTTQAGNISSGNLALARLPAGGVANSGKYLRGDYQWITNCTNWPNCNTSNCICACVCNC